MLVALGSHSPYTCTFRKLPLILSTWLPSGHMTSQTVPRVVTEIAVHRGKSSDNYKRYGVNCISIVLLISHMSIRLWHQVQYKFVVIMNIRRAGYAFLLLFNLTLWFVMFPIFK